MVRKCFGQGVSQIVFCPHKFTLMHFWSTLFMTLSNKCWFILWTCKMLVHFCQVTHLGRPKVKRKQVCWFDEIHFLLIIALFNWIGENILSLPLSPMIEPLTLFIFWFVFSSTSWCHLLEHINILFICIYEFTQINRRVFTLSQYDNMRVHLHEETLPSNIGLVPLWLISPREYQCI